MAIDRNITLTDGRLRLRPLDKSDLNLFYEAVRESVGDLHPWMFWVRQEYSRVEAAIWLDSAAHMWETGTFYNFAIFAADDDTALLGCCGISGINSAHRHANMFYWVRSGRTRSGVATGAARLTAQWAFAALGLNRVEIVVSVENRASLRVAEKSGARREGVLRHRLMVGSAPHDAVMFSLIPADFAAR